MSDRRTYMREYMRERRAREREARASEITQLAQVATRQTSAPAPARPAMPVARPAYESPIDESPAYESPVRKLFARVPGWAWVALIVLFVAWAFILPALTQEPDDNAQERAQGEQENGGA